MLTGAGCARALWPVVPKTDELNLELSSEKSFRPVAQSLNITVIADRVSPTSEAVFWFAVGSSMAASLRVSSGEALRLLRADGSMHQHSLVSGRENTINVFL